MIISLRDEWDKALEESIKALKNGDVIIYPTDTVYGIGADATNEKAVERIYEIKGRSRDKPLSVMVSGLNMLLKYFEPTGEEILTIMKYLPGPYTFILKARERLLFGENEVGVRVPSHYFCRKLSEELGKPIVSTSANISGKESPKEFGEIEPSLIESVAVAVDGGKTLKGTPSTVIHIREKRIIRQGAGPFSFEE